MLALRLSIILLLALCTGKTGKSQDRIISFDPALADIVDEQAEIRELARGFTWAEGPAWDAQRQRLYFSDVPENRAYQWGPNEGVSVFLDPSGLQRGSPDGYRETGSNGLLMMPEDRLLIANHGTRAVEILSLATTKRTTLTSQYSGKRLNSPNDIALSRDGTLYFTDPPYGLTDLDASPLKEQPHNGVYKVAPDGDMVLIDDTLSLPNGIALSPDEATLYVAVSDPDAPIIYAYTKTQDGFGNRRVFFDATDFSAQGWKGLPDGMDVAESGHLFATGPGGVFILNARGAALGLIRLERPTANCTLTAGGRLFITSQDRLLLVQTKASGRQVESNQND